MLELKIQTDPLTSSALGRNGKLKTTSVVMRGYANHLTRGYELSVDVTDSRNRISPSFNLLAGFSEQGLRSLASHVEKLADHAALIDACMRGDLGKLHALRANGLDLFLDDAIGFRIASQYGNAEVVQVFIEAGVDVHINKDEALRNAATAGHPEVARLLLEAGVDVYAQDGYALRWAATNVHLEVLDVLVDFGADPQDPQITRSTSNAAVRAWVEHRRLAAVATDTDQAQRKTGIARRVGV